MKTYKIIGVTGQTGAGKSTVSQIFKNNGAAVINADDVVNEMYLPGSTCVLTLKAAFGEEILSPDGSVNKAELARRAFKSKENTLLLNSIAHPWVFLKTLGMISRYAEQGFKLIVFDAPLLFESNADVMCDFIIAVVCDEKTRLNRIIERDSLTKEQADSRVSAQQSDVFYTQRADFVIDGGDLPEQVEENVLKLLEQIKNRM